MTDVGKERSLFSLHAISLSAPSHSSNNGTVFTTKAKPRLELMPTKAILTVILSTHRQHNTIGKSTIPDYVK